MGASGGLDVFTLFQMRLLRKDAGEQHGTAAAANVLAKYMGEVKGLGRFRCVMEEVRMKKRCAGKICRLLKVGVGRKVEFMGASVRAWEEEENSLQKKHKEQRLSGTRKRYRGVGEWVPPQTSHEEKLKILEKLYKVKKAEWVWQWRRCEKSKRNPPVFPKVITKVEVQKFVMTDYDLLRVRDEARRKQNEETDDALASSKKFRELVALQDALSTSTSSDPSPTRTRGRAHPLPSTKIHHWQLCQEASRTTVRTRASRKSPTPLRSKKPTPPPPSFPPINSRRRQPMLRILEGFAD